MDDEPIDTLNVIPFVDIMLVLLTIVLTTASFIATGRIPVALPQTAHAETGKQQDKTIELTVGGAIYFDGESLTKDTLTERARGLPPETSFLIRADRAIQFQQFVDVTDVLKELKFTKVAVQTRNTAK
ncbi:MAG: biopolymer transporter ExbD [Rhizobiales bacterium]|nr:biopolymer transporter ExbD [Hyphomicrobiales bacterium]